jgi:hypothetical protein
MPRDSRHALLRFSSCAAAGTWSLVHNQVLVKKWAFGHFDTGKDIPVTLDSLTTRANAGSDVAAAKDPCSAVKV